MSQINIKFQNYLNLGNGMMYSIDDLVQRNSLDKVVWHIYIAYNSNRPTHSVIFHNEKMCKISMLTNSFDNVDLNIATNESFQENLLDVAFEPDKTILIKTDVDYWKLRIISENDTESVIQYSKLN